ncbi:MAG: helix-turn-helix domain-containing protein [Methanobacterium sp.]
MHKWLKLHMDSDKKMIITLTVEELVNILDSRISFFIRQAPSKKPEDSLLKPKDVAKMLSVSRVTISQWMKSGRLPYCRIGTRIYFKKSEVLEAMQIMKKYKRNENSH